MRAAGKYLKNTEIKQRYERTNAHRYDIHIDRHTYMAYTWTDIHIKTDTENRDNISYLKPQRLRHVNGADLIPKEPYDGIDKYSR